MNTSYKIEGFRGDPAILERLSEMGFRKDITIKIVQKMPFSGPYVIELGNTHIGLREEEAKCLILKEI